LGASSTEGGGVSGVTSLSITGDYWLLTTSLAPAQVGLAGGAGLVDAADERFVRRPFDEGRVRVVRRPQDLSPTLRAQIKP